MINSRFAEERVKAGKDTAIARTGEVTIGKGTPLEERNIYASDKVDKSMTDICCEVIGDNAMTLAGLAQDEYGGIAGAPRRRGSLKAYGQRRVQLPPYRFRPNYGIISHTF